MPFRDLVWITSFVGDNSGLDESQRDLLPSLTRRNLQICGGGPNYAVRLDFAKRIRLLLCQTPKKATNDQNRSLDIEEVSLLGLLNSSAKTLRHVDLQRLWLADGS